MDYDDREMNVPPGGQEEEKKEVAKASHQDKEQELNEAKRVLVAALQIRRPLREIRTIIEARVVPLEAPSVFFARKDPGPTGMTLLHYAVIVGSPLRVIKYLVQASPVSLTVKTNVGAFLPLHVAARAVAVAADADDAPRRVSNRKVARVLIEAWPGALLERAADGWLPLHVALTTCDDNDNNDNSNKEGIVCRHSGPLDCDTIRLMVQHAPQSLRVPGPDGRLPIHLLIGGCGGAAAAAYSAELLTTIQLVVDACSDALRVRDNHGHLPIHLVNDGGGGGGGRYWREAGHLLRFLVSKCPPSAREPVNEVHNGTLLHLALTKWRWALVTEIQHIVYRCRGIAAIPDAQGNLPLHVAVQLFRCKVVELLVKLNIESVRERGHLGRLPIHVAVAADPATAAHGGRRLAWDADRCLAMLRFLEKLWPESLLEGDDDGKTPLHLAAGGRPLQTGGGTLTVVRGLVEMCPDALGVMDHHGRFPLNDALAHKEGEVDDMGKMLPVQLDEVTSVVQFLVERYPQALRVADPEGNWPLHVAARRGLPLPVLRLMAGLEPVALRAKNKAGWLPVHLALRLDGSENDNDEHNAGSLEGWRARSVDLATVSFWVAPWPASLMERGPDGRTLVHRALLRATTTMTNTEPGGPPSPPPPPPAAWKLAVLWLVDHACPEAALVRDRNGLLPVHIAATANADLSLLHIVLRANPGALRLPVGLAGGGGKPPQLPSSLTQLPGPSSPKRARKDGAQE